MIEFQNVTKTYGDVTALSDVSFQIGRGHFVFLVGSTGSGKTTIFRLLIRDLDPTEGKILIEDWDLTKLPKGKIPHLRRRIGVIFQDLRLLMDRTVIENVILPLEFAGIKDKEARARAEEVLTEVGLAEKINKFPMQLSGGERQRVAIARTLVFNPEVILADEPTGNLDLQTSLQILDLLYTINKKGTTIFMVTHNEDIVRKTHERVIFLEKGKIIEDKKAKSSHHGEEKHAHSEHKKEHTEKTEEVKES